MLLILAESGILLRLMERLIKEKMDLGVERASMVVHVFIMILAAWVAYLVLIPLSLYFGYYPLAFYGCIALVAYALNGIFLWHTNLYAKAFLLVSVDLLLYSSIATYLVGRASFAPFLIYLCFYTAFFMRFTLGLRIFLVCCFLIAQFFLSFLPNVTDLPPGPLRLFHITLLSCACIAEAIMNRYLIERTQHSLFRKEEELRILSNTDFLTGLKNRRYAEEYFDNFLRNRPSPQKGVIAIVDIDNFKKLNDTYGHSHGDLVMKRLAKIMMDDVRSEDLICRWGGEEFLILLPDCTLEGAYVSLERLRKCIAHELSSVGGILVGVTVTIGFSLIGDSVESAIDASDKNLYKGKLAGKNRVYSTQMVEEETL